MARAVEVFRDGALKNEQLNRALQESEERLRQITSSLHEVIWLRDTKTLELLYVNPAYEKVWGRTRESFSANPATGFVDSIHPEDRARVLDSDGAITFSIPYVQTERNGSVGNPRGAQVQVGGEWITG